MVEKEVKERDPKYYSAVAVEKDYNPLFSHAKTRKSVDVDASKDCKQTVTKKQKQSLNIDVTGKEY